MARKEKWEILASEYIISLFPVFMIADYFADNDKAKKRFGQAADLAEKFENHSVVYYYKPSSWGKLHQLFVKEIKENPDVLKQVFHDIRRKCEKQVKYARSLSKYDLTSFSKIRLWVFYNNFAVLNQDTYNSGLLLALLDFQSMTFLSNEIKKFLSAKNQEKHFSLLTTPLQETFNKKHELNLLHILKEIKKSKKSLLLFKQKESREIAQELSQLSTRIFNQIRSHVKKYAWVHYVYEGPAADEVYFIEFLKDQAVRNLNPDEELKNHAKQKKHLRDLQKRILTKLKPDAYERKIILNARELVFYKIYRREMQTYSYYCMERIFSEMARRLGLTLRQFKMLHPLEVKSALTKGEVDLNEINQRLKLLVYDRQIGSKKFLTGSKAKIFLQEIKEEKIDKNAKLIKGSTAQPGKAKGTVKIINSPDEMVKMKRGDILVSAATNPNLMPAIRKAAAIVTDEGGLTCHAAIVSREFKIPCVVGTNFITKVVKDGDKVEVDATKGIVKKI